jgi:hypothetical protein
MYRAHYARGNTYEVLPPLVAKPESRRTPALLACIASKCLQINPVTSQVGPRLPNPDLGRSLVVFIDRSGGVHGHVCSTVHNDAGLTPARIPQWKIKLEIWLLSGVQCAQSRNSKSDALIVRTAHSVLATVLYIGQRSTASESFGPT